MLLTWDLSVLVTEALWMTQDIYLVFRLSLAPVHPLRG